MSERVLIVDDDEGMLQTIAMNVTRAGYTALTAVEGEEAIQIYEREQPDIALVDVRMPHPDGFEVLQAIREQDPEAEVLLVTGHGDLDTAIAALRAGASDFVPKPVDRETLSAALRRAQKRLRLKRKLHTTQEALQASQALYRSIADNIQDGLTIIEHGNVDYVNDRACEIFGYPRDEYVKMTHLDFAAPEEKERLQQIMEETRQTGIAHKELEYWIIHKDGTRRCVRNRYAVLHKNDELTCHLVVTTDITEHKWVKETLAQRAAQLALLNDVGGKIAAVLELDSVLDRAARLVQESFGYHHVALFAVDREQRDLVMKTRAGDFAHLFPLDHRLKLGQGMVGWAGRHGERLLANDVSTEPHYVNLYPDVIPTQSELSVPIRVGKEIVGVLDIQSPQLNAFDENDVLVMETLADQIAVAIENARLYEAVQQELTERKRAEEALRESEVRYRTVSELTSDFAYAVRVEPDGALVPEWVTEAFTRITGFTSDDAQVRSGWESLIHPDDVPVARRHLQAHLSGQQDVAEYRIVTKSGEVCWLRDYGRPVWDKAQGRVVRIYGAAQDITEHKRMEQYVLRTERLAAMGHMAAALAHESKNPLQAIQSHLELVLDFALEPDQHEDYLRFCHQEVEHLTEITERVLSSARPAKDVPSPASIADLVQRALILVNQQLQHARIQVTTDFPADLPPVLVSPDRTGQVLLNLMINAIEAISHSGHIHAMARVDGDMVALTLANDGPPIPPEHIEHIFDPFFTTKPDGTGLGLFISHSIVEQQGGTISVENQRDNQGVVFTITLPIAYPTEGQEAVEWPVLSGPVLSEAEGAEGVVR